MTRYLTRHRRALLVLALTLGAVSVLTLAFGVAAVTVVGGTWGNAQEARRIVGGYR